MSKGTFYIRELYEEFDHLVIHICCKAELFKSHA